MINLNKDNIKKMNIFIPHKKDFNIYFDEIIQYSTSNFIFGKLDDYKPIYEIVNIQFPEAIFDWIPPNNKQLVDLEIKILKWKKKSKIVLILNDNKSHYDKKNLFSSLFKLIQKYTDGVIHLGNYSLNNYKNLFSNKCQHKLIYHPLYESLLDINQAASIQDKFNVDFNNKYVVAVIGNIRSVEEIKYLLKIFKKIPIKNKLLIVPKMYHFFKMPTYFPYRFRKIYKIVTEQIYCFPLKKNQYYFGFNYIENSFLIDLIKKSDLIIIPRKRNLNSGLLYLGLTFDKLMVIPKVGNLTEIAEYFNMPLLDLNKKNYNEVLSRLTDKKINQIFETKKYLTKKKEFHPKEISQHYESFFRTLINV